MAGLNPPALWVLLATGTLMLALAMVCAYSLWQVVSHRYHPRQSVDRDVPDRPR